MKILVANIGSTSFKFRLFDMAGGERELASGGADRIGQGGGVLTVQIGDGAASEQSCDFADHGRAITRILDELVSGGALQQADDLDAVAFKAVMAGDYDPVALVDDELLERMQYFVPVAPAHNPAYIAAMKMFRQVLTDTPLVAAFEPGFHGTIPSRRRYYAVPPEWAEKFGIKKYGFHGASHRYIATRTAELIPEARRVISCHLGGSSSICAIRDGKSVANSFGFSAQSGLPHSSRAGDFDAFALLLLSREAGMDTEQALEVLGKGSGLAALSGTSGDMRDIREAEAGGDERAELAIDVFVTAVRDYIGAYLVELGGADALVFTGGIGQNDSAFRLSVCEPMQFAGIVLDGHKNDIARGEGRIDAASSDTAIWIMPTNEELIVARQAAALLDKKS